MEKEVDYYLKLFKTTPLGRAANVEIAFRAGFAYAKHGEESAMRKLNISDMEAWCGPNPGPPTLHQITTANDEDMVRGIK